MKKQITPNVLAARRVRYDAAPKLVPVPLDARDLGVVHLGGYQPTN